MTMRIVPDAIVRRRLLTVATVALLAESLTLAMGRSDSALRLDLLLQTAVLALFGIWLRALTQTYLNAPFIFVGSVYIWHTSFLFGHFFKIASIFEFTGTAFTYGFEYVYLATAFVGMCVAFTVVGVLIAESRAAGVSVSRKPAFDDQVKNSLEEKLQRAGWISLSVMTAILIYFIAQNGAATFGGEYLDVYYQASSSWSYLLFYRTQFLWVFVILVTICANRRNRRMLTILGCGFLLLTVLTAMLGSRSMPFICVTTLLVAVDCFVRRIRLLLIALFLLAISAASYVIDTSRGSGLGLHVFNFSDSSRDSIDLLHFFYQDGLIIRNVLRTMDFTKGSAPAFGATFADAALSVVPRPILDFVGYPHQQTPSEWLVEQSPDVLPYRGLGYSLVAEMYYNFRMLGCVGFLACGWYVGRCYFVYSYHNDITEGINALMFALIFTLHMRSDASVYLRLLIFAYLIVTFIRQSAGRLGSREVRVRRVPISPDSSTSGYLT